MPQIKTQMIWLTIRDDFDYSIYLQDIIYDNDENRALIAELENTLKRFEDGEELEYENRYEVVDYYADKFETPNFLYRDYRINI